MARRRIPGRESWPTGMRQEIKRGELRYLVIKTNKKKVWFPAETLLEDAIAACREYNKRHRNPVEQINRKLDKKNKPLKEWMTYVITEYKKDTKNSAETIKTFEKDCGRLLETLGEKYTKEITFDDVNEYLEFHYGGKSNNVWNRKISSLATIFDFLVDTGAMKENLAKLKKFKTKEEKGRVRIDWKPLMEILDNAPLFLQTAIQLSMQTTHAVLEISRMKYSDCEWLSTPIKQDKYFVFGYLKVARQKSKRSDTSRVAIPITTELKRVIDESKDEVDSPYVVHKLLKKTNGMSKECDHPTQLTSRYISTAFSTVRDKLGLYSELPKRNRPSFHEIRSISIAEFAKSGTFPQKRAAHKDPKTTQGYIEGHTDWTEVEPAELKFKESSTSN